MRSDFDKVLVERPRSGRRGEREGARCYTQNDLRHEHELIPSFESTSRNRGGTKYLNEHLGPLLRFLRASVGRPWNAVHSELRTYVNRGNAVQAHVLQHLRDYVEFDVEWRDGGVHITDRWRRQIFNRSDRRFFVCPRTHTLKRFPRSTWKRPRTRGPDAPQRAIDDRHAYRCIDGAWFEITFELLPYSGAQIVYDVVVARSLVGGASSRALLDATYGRSDVYAAAKRALGKREIRRAGLRTEK